jgi:hypothetical protein
LGRQLLEFAQGALGRQRGLRQVATIDDGQLGNGWWRASAGQYGKSEQECAKFTHNNPP